MVDTDRSYSNLDLSISLVVWRLVSSDDLPLHNQIIDIDRLQFLKISNLHSLDSLNINDDESSFQDSNK